MSPYPSMKLEVAWPVPGLNVISRPVLPSTATHWVVSPAPQETPTRPKPPPCVISSECWLAALGLCGLNVTSSPPLSTLVHWVVVGQSTACS